MISKELYKCAVKYYNFHEELTVKTKIFGFSKASLYRFLKNDNKSNENKDIKNIKNKFY